MSERPSCIVHWRDIQGADDVHYPGSDELLRINAPLGEAVGLTVMGVHHQVLRPGRRSSWPHAERDEEEFVYVLEGRPQVWLDGEIHQLEPGDGIGFPKGTGIAHTIINNTQQDVCLLIVGEKSTADGQLHYPLHPARNAEMGAQHWTEDRPERPLGLHDGLPDRLRDRSAR